MRSRPVTREGAAVADHGATAEVWPVRPAGDRGSADRWTGAAWNPTTVRYCPSPGFDHGVALIRAPRPEAMGVAARPSRGNARTSRLGFGVALRPEVVALPRRWRDGRTVPRHSWADLLHEQMLLALIRTVFETNGFTDAVPVVGSHA